MGLVTPDYGLLFWTMLSFSILLFILRKFAWKPILLGLKSREESIAKALKQADEARAELTRIQESNQVLAEKARLERERDFQEAKAFREKLIEEAKEEARAESQKMIEKAREIIKQEKEAAKKELYVTVASLALELSEKILRKQFSDKDKQSDYINELLKEMSKN
ncbi:MAG TPA: F0F1 ATP synthase subunit B [Tenuifilaceae bacterium]|nr:F0F1 ATP synthase subunit B [Tenuifilaceae bacterium]HOZ13606.1 F0F1 ATP synthase subunit B [Tenuifilaceae bacterium]HPI46087.1 F0F1 ATP synthase subunit B [Tenuifilaceae bacterium]HPN20328.1 F0F1 ATP synthase subunit B [Tenuifilaceae bacterium]HPV55915.1 F0F1 ATP synthase subunit B [Tenuifilaceae bacterium]